MIKAYLNQAFRRYKLFFEETIKEACGSDSKGLQIIIGNNSGITLHFSNDCDRDKIVMLDVLLKKRFPLYKKISFTGESSYTDINKFCLDNRKRTINVEDFPEASFDYDFVLDYINVNRKDFYILEVDDENVCFTYVRK